MSFLDLIRAKTKEEEKKKPLTVGEKKQADAFISKLKGETAPTEFQRQMAQVSQNQVDPTVKPSIFSKIAGLAKPTEERRMVFRVGQGVQGVDQTQFAGKPTFETYQKPSPIAQGQQKVADFIGGANAETRAKEAQSPLKLDFLKQLAQGSINEKQYQEKIKPLDEARKKYLADVFKTTPEKVSEEAKLRQTTALAGMLEPQTGAVKGVVNDLVEATTKKAVSKVAKTYGLSFSDDTAKVLAKTTDQTEIKTIVDSITPQAPTMTQEAPKLTPKVETPQINPLIEEAKKYKTEEEFINAQGTPVYHGTNTDFNEFKLSEPKDAMGNFKGAYTVDNVKEAKDYGKNIKEAVVSFKNPLVGNPYEEFAKAKGINFEKNRFNIKKADVKKWLEENDFDGIIRPKGSQYNLEGAEYIALKNDAIKTKSQLSEIYKQAKEVPKVETQPTFLSKVDEGIKSSAQTPKQVAKESTQVQKAETSLNKKDILSYPKTSTKQVGSQAKRTLTDVEAEKVNARQYQKKLVDDSARERKAFEESLTGGQLIDKIPGESGYESYGGSMNLKRISEHSKEYRDYFKKNETKPPLSFYRKLAEKEIKTGKHVASDEYNAINDFIATLSDKQKYEPVQIKIKGNDGVDRVIKIKQNYTAKPGQEPVSMSSARKFFTSGSKVLQKSGEAGKKLAQVMETQRKAEDLLRGRWNVHIDTALDGLSKEQLANVDAVIRGETKPMDSKTAGASKSLRNWFNSIGKKAEEMGFEIQTKDGVKVPFKMRENYAPQMYNFTDFQKGAMREKALEHLVKTGQARNLGEATKLLDDFVKRNSERRFGNLEKAREIDLPGFERNPKVYAKKYAESIAKRFTEVENFGKKDATVAKFIDQIAQEGGDYNAAQEIFDFTTKGLPQNKAVSAITQYNVATSLDLSAITNITQNINTMSEAGILNTLKGAYKGFTKEGKKIAEKAGVFEPNVNIKETGVDLNKIVKGVMWPFQQVENFNRRTAANAGVFRAKQLAERYSKEATEFTIRKLEELGVDPQKLAKGKLSADDLVSAAWEMSGKTQFKVDPLDVPVKWKTPAGRLAMQFQSFNFMQTKFIRDQIIKEAKKGNYAPVARFIPLAIGASFLAQKARNLVTGRDEKQQNTDVRAWDKYLKAFGDFATSKIIQAEFLYDTYKNKNVTPLKKVTRTLSSVGGITVGKIGNVLSALEAIPGQKERNLYLRKDGKEVDPYLEGKRFLAGEVPFIGEYAKNKVFGFPKSETTPEKKALNKAVYSFAEEMNKLPYGDEKAKLATRGYLEAIPDEEERKRQAYILSQNGVDIKRISTSNKMIEAKKIYAKLKDEDPAKANSEVRVLKKEKPKVYEALKTVVNDSKLSEKELDMRDLGVENGERAKAIFDEVNKLGSNNEKNAYIKDLEVKRIISKEVRKQLAQLIAK